MKPSRELELLVQRIQQQLAPDADVLHDVRIEGRRTNTKRQIDVLVKQRVGQYEITIIIDCKDYKHPVDVKGVEEFYGLLDDVGAQKGVLVCPSGFTSTAKRRAADLQIDLYSPVDTDPHKWQVSPTMPTVCDFRIAAIGFGVSVSAPLPFQMQADFFSANLILDERGSELGTAYRRFAERWNTGEFFGALGESKEIPIFGDTKVQTDNGYGQLCPVSLTARINVQSYLFSGQLPVRQMSGFRDEISGNVITNAFSVGLLDPKEIWDNWSKIRGEEELDIPPVMRLEGLVCVDEDSGYEIKF